MTIPKSRRVCITGMGIVSPLGNSRELTWQNVLVAKSGAAPITQFDASTWPTTFACEVKNFQLQSEFVRPDLRSLLNRPAEFAMAAAYEAMQDAKFLSPPQSDKFGISMGAGIGAISPAQLATLLHGLPLQEGLPDLVFKLEESSCADLILKNHPGTVAGVLSSQWAAHGPVTTIHSACASSGQSIGQAYLQIKRGEADVILAGGADSLAGELLLAGFCLLGALSRRNDDPEAASRPFDKDRDGFVASEGAAMLVLEERESALRRGAKIYAEISGYGETESAYRITDLPPDGRGIVEAMQMALQQAGLSSVDYINAHGTSTELNDRIEALAIRRVFAGATKIPMTSSTKSETGHLISAAGALELSFCALAVRDGLIPPTRNLKQTDCGTEMDFVANEARQKRIRSAMSNSIGFGGTNTALLVTDHD